MLVIVVGVMVCRSGESVVVTGDTSGVCSLVASSTELTLTLSITFGVGLVD